jgi:CRP/FNR family transcriptional regulator
MMATVHAPYNLEVADTCLNCQLRGRGYFCHLAGEELQALAAISYSTVYPEGSVLFVEGQMPRGVYILCRGKAKLSMVSKEGKTLILRISEPGDVLGLSSCLLSQPYQGTVETLTPCQVNFIRREDFLRSTWLKPANPRSGRAAGNCQQRWRGARGGSAPASSCRQRF